EGGSVREPAYRVAAADLVDRRNRGIEAAAGRGPYRSREACRLVELLRRAGWSGRKAHQERAILPQQGVLDALGVGERSEELEEVARQDRGLDHADEVAIQYEPAADGEERLGVQHRRVDLAVIGLRASREVRLNEFAIGEAHLGRWM